MYCYSNECTLLIIQELSVDKIKLDGVNTLAQKLISQDHTGSAEIQKSLDKVNARYACNYTYVCAKMCI